MKVCEICSARFRDGLLTCPLDGGVLRDISDPLIGRTIGGRYIVLEKIGTGGMGTVYRAHHEVVGRDVALKFLAKELAVDPTSRKRFLREAKAANRIQHEHIIAITDFGETEDGYVYLVMEHLVGKTLGQAIHEARGPLELTRSLQIGMQISLALARAHELDVVHRDIKPDNIFLSPRSDGTEFVKIVDFGLAHMKGEMRLTASGAVFGTAEYMAPELARNEKLGPSIDLYSFGCVLFEMTTGRLPFMGNTAELVVQHLREIPPKPSDFVQNLPDAFDDLVLSLLEKQAQNRPENAFQVYESLRVIAKDITLFGHSTAPPSRMSMPALPAAPTSEPRDTQFTIRGQSMWWGDRVALFRSVAQDVHGGAAKMPPWIREVLSKLDELVLVMTKSRDEMHEATNESSKVEARVRETRLRIGRALDELVRDESRARESLARCQTKIAEVAQSMLSVVQDLKEQRDVVTKSADMSRAAAHAWIDAGRAAQQWLYLDDARNTEDAMRARAERDLEDVSFQVAQLKGRLATLGAESEIDLESLRKRATELNTMIAQSLDGIVKQATPLVEYLMKFPEARDAFFGTRGAGNRSTQ